MLTLALSKGRILEETLPLLEKAGAVLQEDPATTRKLIIATKNEDLRVLVVRAQDVPTYVAWGGADFGITGRDVLAEHGSHGLYVLEDLAISQCRLMTAVKADVDYEDFLRRQSRIRVATKYPELARAHFTQKEIHVDMIKLYGSMELAPLTGMADVIVDLVSTGKTLKENGLKAVECILEVNACLIANKWAFKVRHASLKRLAQKLKGGK